MSTKKPLLSTSSNDESLRTLHRPCLGDVTPAPLEKERIFGQIPPDIDFSAWSCRHMLCDAIHFGSVLIPVKNQHAAVSISAEYHSWVLIHLLKNKCMQLCLFPTNTTLWF